MSTRPHLIVTGERTPLRLWLVPPLSVAIASLGALLPLAGETPVLPPFGLLMLLGWRLLRPEMWPAWVGLPLGLVDDLLTGAPLGQAVATWTVALIAIDIVDHRILFRDRLEDWVLAASVIAGVGAASWALSWLAGGAGPLWTIVPPMLTGTLCFPLAARLAAMLDRVRLRIRRA